MRSIRSHTSFVYGLCEPETKDIRYVGVSTHLKSRYLEHLKDRLDSHKSRWIRTLVSKGLKPRLIILQCVLNENRDLAERNWIKLLRESGAKLTNLTDGGDGALGAKRSEEFKRNIGRFMSKFRKGKPLSEEHKKVLSEATKGRPLSPEHRAKISKHNKEREVPYKVKYPSEEHKRKVALSRIGYKNSQATKDKMSKSALDYLDRMNLWRSCMTSAYCGNL